MGRSKTDLTELPYRKGVGVMLLNPDGEVFVAQRIDSADAAWQMPQGGIDSGETPRAAALRELEEETGTAKAEVIGETRDWLRYDLPMELVPKVWKGRFRGQEQKWFAMRFLGQNGDIDIATKHPEFSAWRWVSIDALCGLIVPFKQQLYTELVEEFRDLAVALPTARH